MELIKLLTSEKEELIVDRRVAIRSNLIRTLLEDIPSSDSTEHPIPLNNIQMDVLKKVIDYCDHHKDDPIIHDDVAIHPEAKDGEKVPAPQVVYDEIISKQKRKLDEWDTSYLASMDKYDIYDVVLAANYLEIPDLLETTCREVATRIKSLSPEKIREELNITQDLTPEEVDRITRENEWAADA